jgi:hypothetical protein
MVFLTKQEVELGVGWNVRDVQFNGAEGMTASGAFARSDYMPVAFAGFFHTIEWGLTYWAADTGAALSYHLTTLLR